MFNHLLVIEFASVLAGPSVGMFLAELGARVIKIENLHAGGDVTRSWKLKEEDSHSDRSAYFCSVNWGKESLALDLKKPAGQHIAHQLVEKADIAICSYLPGSAERLNMGAERLMAINPRLIVAEVNGYGPSEGRAAFDAVIQAEAGFMYLNGEAGRGLCKIPVALMDVLAAHQLKEALLLASIRRIQTGKGERVSISMIESAVASLINQGSNWLVAGVAPSPIGSEHPNIAPYGAVFQTADAKPLILAVGNDRQFRALWELLQLPWVEEYATNAGRVKRREALKKQLAEAIKGWPCQRLIEALHEAGVPAGIVNAIPAAMAMPQVQRLNLQQNEWKGIKSFVGRGLQGLPDQLGPPPALSEHRQQILENLLKIPTSEIVTLLSEKVIQ